METVLKSPRPPKRRTCTPTDSANASPSVSTPLGAELVSITVANAVGSPRACGSRPPRAAAPTPARPPAPLGRFRLAPDVPARRFEPAEEERERFLRREHAVDRAGCRCTDRGGRADAARGHGALATREGRPGGHRPVLHSRAPPPLASDVRVSRRAPAPR